MAIPVVTIDGPSGSGKGTVGQAVALSLKWHFLDSGALYRILAYVAQSQNIHQKPKENLQLLLEAAETMTIRFLPQDGAPPRVLYHNQDIGDALRTEEIGEIASRLAVIPEIRQALLRKQHGFRQAPGLIADGRDMGTVVFPDAMVKIFLTADPDIRAQRRYKQLKDKGFDVNLARLLDEIRERDRRDAERQTSPLRPAEDAHILDTSEMGIDQVIEHVREWVADKA